MLYKLYKLKFVTPVHFGSHKIGTSLENVSSYCHSDTFFSALCLEYLKLFGKGNFSSFIENFNNGKIVISSLFPYDKDDMYLPKPALIVKRQNSHEADYKNKKKFKKLEFIKIKDFKKYINCLKTGGTFDCSNYDNYAYYNDSAKVSLRNDDENNRIYHVGTYTFIENAGLYFIAKFENESIIEQFENILESLQYSGLGGKRSSGYGKFEIDETIELTENLTKSEEELINMLKSQDNQYNMLISLYSPDEKETEITSFENSYYNLIKRNGFVYSPDYAENILKRKSIVMFKEGSCFDFVPSGSIQDVGNYGNHSVFKYAKALTIGINL